MLIKPVSIPRTILVVRDYIIPSGFSSIASHDATGRQSYMIARLFAPSEYKNVFELSRISGVQHNTSRSSGLTVLLCAHIVLLRCTVSRIVGVYDNGHRVK